MIKWKRREAGNYIAVGVEPQLTLVNMKNSGPNAPIWQGPVPAWQVRVGGRGEYDIGCKIHATVWTLAEAKQVAEEM